MLLHDAAARDVSRRRGIAYDHRNAIRLVAIADLAQQVVIAQLLAVIAGEDDQRVFPLPGLLEVVEDAAELLVDLAHQAIVGRAHLAHLGLAHRAAQALAVLEEARLLDVLDVVAQQRMLPRFFSRARRAYRRRHVGGIVHRVIRRGRDEGRMRPVIAEMQEPRLAAAPAQVGQRALGEPGGVRKLLGNTRGTRRRAGLARGRSFGQPDLVAILGQLVALARDPAEIGILVGSNAPTERSRP